MAIYLELSNGRVDPRHDACCGAEGPCLGPLKYCRTIYGHEIECCPIAARRKQTSKVDELNDFDEFTAEHDYISIDNGMIKYNGVYYSDWLIHSEPPEHKEAQAIDRTLIGR